MSVITQSIMEVGADYLNALTKYPKVPSYHTKNSAGVMSDTCSINRQDSLMQVSEKVIGQQVRIIRDDSGMFIIADKDNLLYAKGNMHMSSNCAVVHNAMYYVDELISDPSYELSSGIEVLYGIVYGYGKGEWAKNYPSDGEQGIVWYDRHYIDTPTLKSSASLKHEDLIFVGVPDDLVSFEQAGMEDYVAELGMFDGTLLPESPTDTKEWIKQFRNSTYPRPYEIDGVILRSGKGDCVREITFSDYDNYSKRTYSRGG